MIDYFNFSNTSKRIFLFFVRFAKRRIRKLEILPQPILFIEVTNVCNSKCVFCPNKIMKRTRQHLDMALFKKAVDEFVTMGGVNISFSPCIGEPLLDPYILERARYIKQFPQIKSLGFLTTLQWLHKFNIDEFFEARFTKLCISTMLLGREKYMEFFGVDNYEQTFKNIIRLIDENKKRQNKIIIDLSIKPTEPIRVIINHPDFKLVDKLMDGKLLIQAKNMGLCVDDWCGTVKLPLYLRKRPLYPKLFRPCRLFCNSLIIFSNGKVGLCVCRDFETNSELILGDMRKDSLKEIWEGQKHTTLYDNWREENIIPAICKRCSQYIY